MKEVRLLETGFSDAFTNMAVDEAIMELHKPNSMPTIRFYGWRPHAVSIGFPQPIGRAVDLAKARALGVDVVRRITPGGAWFHEKEIAYSFVCTASSGIVPEKTTESHEKICSALAEGLAELDVEASFSPPNDIIVNGRKISGSAQVRKGGKLLQHGTLLMGLSADKMFSLLKVPHEKTALDKKQELTSLERETGREYSLIDVARAMEKGFEKELGARLLHGELGSEEKELAEELRGKFASREWNYKK
jgi:lipoate-protein ligase A